MWAINLAVVAAILYLTAISGMYLAQTWLLFPTTLAAGQIALPASAQRLQVKTSDGNLLSGVHLPASGDDNKVRPLLLGFGGNAWNAEAMAVYLDRILPEHDVVAFHYRGYRPSTGRPSADALLGDAPTIFDHVQQTFGPREVIAVGFSIGSGVAASLARQRPVAGLILVTPFDSLEALARDLYWWVPVGLLLRHRMPVVDFVRSTTLPVAVIAAGQDAIVPARRSDALRGAIPNLVLDRTIEGGHNDLYDKQAFADALEEAVAKVAAFHTPNLPPAPN